MLSTKIQPNDPAPLSPTGKAHFEARRNMNGIISFESNLISRNPKKWRDAFRHVVSSCKQLQRTVQVVHEVPNAVQNQFKSREPTIDVIPLDKIKSNRGEKAGNELSFLKAEGQKIRANMRLSLSALDNFEETPAYNLIVLLGKTAVVMVGVMPHTLGDGVSLVTVPTLTVLYASFPKVLWFALDRQVPTFHPPSALEMALKGDYKRFVGDSKLCSPLSMKPSADRYFSFPKEDKTDKFKFHQKWQVPREAIDRLKTALRKDHNLPLSVCFTAVATKIAATLLQRHDPRFLEQENIYATTPFDMRTLGKWGDKKRDGKPIPIIGDYAQSLLTPISAKELLRGPITESAKVVAADVSKLKNDAEYRAAKVLGHGAKPTPNLLCGVSSVLVPKSTARLMKNFETEGETDLNMNRVWIGLITTPKSPSSYASLDVALPLEGLSNEAVKSAVKEVVLDTVFEEAFSHLI